MIPLLEVRDIRKAFPGVQALDGVSLRLHRAEVLAVVGENGAGKSTLMKILAGIYKPDSGEVLLDGKPLRLGSVSEALRHGISLIHQELNLAENLSIAANLFLGREYVIGGPLGLLHSARMQRLTAEVLDAVGLDEKPQAIVGSLSPGKRQLVEIARALSMQARIIIMDEPTSSLTQKEAEKLFQVIADLRKSGVAVVYISHRLAEVERTADRVVVLRDGRFVGELHRNGRGESNQITHDAMVRLMVGRELNQFFQRQHSCDFQKVRLELDRLKYMGVPSRIDGVSEPISLQVHAGEILGVAGLVGAGRTELAEALFGLRPILAGDVKLSGSKVRIESPLEAIAAGVLLVPEDRRRHGLVLQESIRRNIALPNLDQICTLGIVSPREETRLAATMCEKLKVRTPSLRQLAGLLSGGNQQKVVLGKWLARKPQVLIVDEPTRGIDVGAKSEIYALLDNLAAEGVAIVMISSDLEEILGMSDRVAVLHEGRLAGVLDREQLSEEAIMHLATGGDLRR